MAQISKECIRKEKIKRLKEKVKNEYAQLKTLYREQIADLDDNEWETSLLKLNAIYWLNHYFSENTCMSYETKWEDQDYISYILSDETIDMMLDSDCNLCRRFLTIITLGDAWSYSSQLLNDDFFEREFFTTFEKMVYNKK